MAFDIYTNAELQEIVRYTLPDANYFKQRWFSQQRFSATNNIIFDEMVDKRIRAPFVMPHVDGRPIVESGYSSNTYQPAYIKLRDGIQAADLTNRAFGEAINSIPEPLQRFNQGRANALRQHREAVERTIEWMCSQYMQFGAYTVSGDRYPTRYLNFGRDAGNTVALSGGRLWTAPSTAQPLTDFESLSRQIFVKGKAPGTLVTMTPEDWALFRECTQVKEKFQFFKDIGGPLPNITPQAAAKVLRMGMIGGFEIEVYHDTWEDDSGTEQRYLPIGTVLMSAPSESGLGGRQLYGRIQHLAAQLNGQSQTDIYHYEWMGEDGEAHNIGTHCAPLIAARKVNCSAALIVR